MLEAQATRGRLREVALLFLRLGATSFGGPAVHVAMMEDEVVRRRAWLSRDEFLDLVGATNLIPGPNSTEMAIHLGHRRAGWPGLLLAGACFIAPAVAIVWVIAFGYARYGRIPEVARLLYGIKPVVMAVVLQAIWGLGRSALKDRTLVLIGLAGVALCLTGTNELWVLLAAGVTVVLIRQLASRSASHLAAAAPFWTLPALLPAAASSSQLTTLFLVFLKVGAVLFGSGYVLLAFLRSELVVRLGWLSEAELLDAVAVGQITPGPVFSTATFVGYLVAGSGGAAVATFGIFVPAFFFVALSGPLVPRLRRSRAASAFLDGVNAASLSLMAVVSAQLARDAVPDLFTGLLFALSALLLLRWRVNSSWLVLGGALLGLALGSSPTFALGEPRQAGSDALLERGRNFYTALCERCHGAAGDDTAYPGSVPLVGIQWRLGEDEIVQLSAPFVGRTFEGDDARALLAYLATLKGSHGFEEPWWLIAPGLLEHKLSDRRGYTLLDVRAEADYEQGHIPNAASAAFLDAGDRCGRPGPDPAPVVRLAIARDAVVVVYDEIGGLGATCAWWSLREAGHARVTVLDGGFRRWVEEGQPISTTTATPPVDRSRGSGPRVGSPRPDAAGRSEPEAGGPVAEIRFDWQAAHARDGFRSAGEIRSLLRAAGLERSGVYRLIGSRRELSHLVFIGRLLGSEATSSEHGEDALYWAADP